MNSSEVNVLLIVEGRKLEPRFFKQISKVYGLNINICCFETNIYTLYRELSELGFDCDIKVVLQGRCVNSEDRKTLSKRFAFTYLVFDCDCQHCEKNEAKCDVLELADRNMRQIKEMVEYFNNETDPTRGKLYVNYPMMESFKDADSFFDENYAKNYVSVFDLKHYKRNVGNKRLSSKRIDRYRKCDFQSLIKMNLFKLLSISRGSWGRMDYSDYINLSASSEIVDMQLAVLKEHQQIAVLNTALFFVIDYFGNRGGFYDCMVCAENVNEITDEF